MVAFWNRQESMLVLSNNHESNGTYSLFQKLNILLQMIAFFGLLHRLQKRGGGGAFFCEGATFFYFTAVNSLSLGPLWKVQVNVELSESLKPNKVPSRLGTFYFFICTPSLPHHPMEGYSMQFLLSAAFKIASNTWNAKMMSTSYKKRQKPPFLDYQGRGKECPLVFSAPHFLFRSAAAVLKSCSK